MHGVAKVIFRDAHPTAQIACFGPIYGPAIFASWVAKHIPSQTCIGRFGELSPQRLSSVAWADAIRGSHLKPGTLKPVIRIFRVFPSFAPWNLLRPFREEKAYTTTTERNSFGQLGCENQENHIYHRNLSSVAPIFVWQRKVLHWSRAVYAFFFPALVFLGWEGPSAFSAFSPYRVWIADSENPTDRLCYDRP